MTMEHNDVICYGSTGYNSSVIVFLPILHMK